MNSLTRIADRILVWRPEGRRPLGRNRRRLENNIKMNLKVAGESGMDKIGVVHDRERWRGLVFAKMRVIS
jgi:hypothetical protein